MNLHGNNPETECPLYSAFVADFAALGELALPSAHTILLIVADSREVHTDTVGDAAEHLLASGLTYVCVWGPDCERVHDIFDEVYVGDGSKEPDHAFMSTCHARQPLDEALWFFLHCAHPDDRYLASTSHLAVTVGCTEWAAGVEEALSDVSAYVSRMLAGDSQSTGKGITAQ